MKDLIDRQAAIEAVRVGSLSTATLYGRTEEGETARKEIERVIKALPSIETENTWVPVSERLPELLEDVLICDSGGCINIGFCVKRKYASGKEYTSWVEVGSDWDATPIAWHPLPKPYKAETELRGRK